MLKVENLHSYYGSSHILQGISIELSSGEVLAILGRNGVGKTTLVRSIVGLRPPDVREGQTLLDDKSITELPVPEIGRAGIGLIPQGRRVFGSLSVAEHLEVAEVAGERKSTGWGWTSEQVLELFPILADRSQQRARHLSGGEQAMLAIGRALLSRPRVLVMDEPTEGLAPVIVENLVASFQTLKSAGMTILLIEQQIQVARELADRILIMERGTLTSSFSRHEFASRWNDVRRALGV